MVASRVLLALAAETPGVPFVSIAVPAPVFQESTADHAVMISGMVLSTADYNTGTASHPPCISKAITDHFGVVGRLLFTTAGTRRPHAAAAICHETGARPDLWWARCAQLVCRGRAKWRARGQGWGRRMCVW